MPSVSRFAEIPLCNIPLGNLRAQFYNYYHLFKDTKFLEHLRKVNPGEPIETPYISWYYWPEQFFTFLVLHSVVGLEAYVSGAAFFELGSRDILTTENLRYTKNPFLIPGKAGTAKRYYVLLPRLIDSSLSLNVAEPSLWEKVCLFYEEIRNPLFHGTQIDSNNPKYIIEVLELLADIYAWVDSWHNPNNVIPGNDWFTKLKRT